LFPFLAVLLCTMGALIVVLIVIARQARIQVAEDIDDSPQRAELETQKADLKWRIEMLRESRTKTLAQLEKQREELSHLEDHSRRLRSQLEELEHARSEFEKLAAGGDVETERLKREIDEISAKIAAKERELDDAMKKRGKGGQSYAVVPYHGPNETRRRPIYIECRSDGVVLQPEGIVLTEKDFEGDLGPGSPLVSALRAAREYLSRNQLPGEEGAPYPLILVRPDGIVAYEVVQASMESWGSEYGYELVGDDWELDFPPADPKLTLAMRQAIGEGRLRQAYLAHAAPRLRSATGHHSYRASPTGGLMRDDGMPINADPQMARGGAARPSWARGGRSVGGRSGGSAHAGAAPKRSANPYAAALHGQSAAGGAGGSGSGMTLGSGEGSLLGVGAGDLAGGQLNAAPGSPTGVLFRTPRGGPNGAGPGGGAGTSGGAGSSLLGSGAGTSAVPSDNLLASGGNGGPAGQRGPGLGGNGNGRPKDGRLANGRSGAPGGTRGYGGAPGTEMGGDRGRKGQGGRGWGGGQDKIDAVAANLDARPGNDPAEKTQGRGPGGPAGLANSGGAGGPAGSGDKASGPGQNGKPGSAAPNAGDLAATKASGAGGPGGGGAAQGPELGSAQPTGSAEGSERVDGSMADGPSDKPGGKASEGNATEGDGSGSADGVASNGTSTGGDKSSGTISKGAGSKNSTSGGGGSGSQASSLAGAQSAGASGTSSMASAGGGGAGQPQQPGAMAMPVPMPNMTFGDKSQQKSIANQRGEKNWANPAANHAAFPVTRPIKIVCDSDHLTLLPEGRSRRGYKVIELGESNEENVRELVTSVWDRIETWGIAGQGMYWRPELIMEVEPGAEDRFNELKALMADSGLDVRGRPRSATAIRYPRTKTPN